jgi:hypothetical protein
MISEKFKDIILTLIESTKSENLIWIMQIKNTFNSEIELSSNSEDKFTRFILSIKYTLNDKWILEPSAGLWIKNKSLPGEQMYITSYNNPDLFILRDLLIEMYCSNIKPSNYIIEDKLSDICKSISKSTYRDNIITRIFNGKK